MGFILKTEKTAGLKTFRCRFNGLTVEPKERRVYEEERFIICQAVHTQIQGKVRTVLRCNCGCLKANTSFLSI